MILSLEFLPSRGWSDLARHVGDSRSHLAISTNYSDNLIKRRLVPPIMLAAQLSITLSIHGEGYQNRRSRVCLLARRPSVRAIMTESACGRGNRFEIVRVR